MTVGFSFGFEAELLLELRPYQTGFTDLENFANHLVSRLRAAPRALRAHADAGGNVNVLQPFFIPYQKLTSG
jgi:hypothetical protein